MSGKTGIAWTDATWNPLVGCSVVSPGCTNCYAMREAGGRLRATPKFIGLTTPSKAGPVWNGEVRLWESALYQPLRWTKPRMIFVNSMSDLFHESVPDEWIDRIFAVMALCPQHVFQVLTKRAQRMRDYTNSHDVGGRWAREAFRIKGDLAAAPAEAVEWTRQGLRNVWLGISVEDQARADERIPLLAETPAAIRWISAEPLLENLDLTSSTIEDSLGLAPALVCIDWVVCGAESGPSARPFNVEWARSLISQCRTAGVWCFVKQLGPTPIGIGYPFADYRLRDRKGADPTEWPSYLRVREYPCEHLTP